LTDRFENHINTVFPYLKGKKLLIAVSGGIDSVVLADLMRQNNFDIALAHCNFQLRGKDSDKDEAFVKDLAKKMEIPVFAVKFDTKKYASENKISTQVAARELRYKWFEKIRKEHRFSFILTAHHADDDLETVLINLIRGTGLEGLTGIPERNKNIIRPLLPFPREEIENYADDKGLKWREDLSNNEDKYTRNKIRHHILPVLKELNPGFNDSFRQTLSHLKGSSAIVKESVSKARCRIFKKTGKDSYELEIKKIRRLKNTRHYLYEMLKDFGFTEWDDVYRLLEAQPGKQVFSDTHRLIKDRDLLLLTGLSSADNVRSKEFKISSDQKKLYLDGCTLLFRDIPVKEIKKEKIVKSDPEKEVYLDKKSIKFPLTVRKWKEGDYFYPIGMQGKKKLSKFFKDEKLSVLDKENIWLLCDQNKIAWVIGKRMDDRFKITENTKEILKIEIQT
jgi:tRNA(Ile)-lysidine synthase